MIIRIHDGWILTPDRQSGRGEATCLRYKTACAWSGESIGAGCVFSPFFLVAGERSARRGVRGLQGEGGCPFPRKVSNRDLVWDSGRRSGQSLSLLYDGPPRRAIRVTGGGLRSGTVRVRKAKAYRHIGIRACFPAIGVLNGSGGPRR